MLFAGGGGHCTPDSEKPGWTSILRSTARCPIGYSWLDSLRSMPVMLATTVLQAMGPLVLLDTPLRFPMP